MAILDYQRAQEMLLEGNWQFFGTWLTLISVNVSYGAHKNKIVATVVIFCWHTQSMIKYKAQQTVPASSSETLSPLLQCLMPSKPWWLGGNNIDLGLLGIWKCQIAGLQRSTFSDAKVEKTSKTPFPPVKHGQTKHSKPSYPVCSLQKYLKMRGRPLDVPQKIISI